MSVIIFFCPKLILEEFQLLCSSDLHFFNFQNQLLNKNVQFFIVTFKNINLFLVSFFIHYCFVFMRFYQIFTLYLSIYINFFFTNQVFIVSLFFIIGSFIGFIFEKSFFFIWLLLYLLHCIIDSKRKIHIILTYYK